MTTVKTRLCVDVRWGAAIFLIMVMIVSLSACAGSSKSQAQQPPETSPSVQEAPAPAQPASAAPPAIQAQEKVKDIPREAFRIVYNASLREAPRSNAQVITLLAKGEKVFLISTAGNWMSVESSDGKIGWILRKQVVPLKEGRE